MTKSLFVLKNTKTGKTSAETFANKMDAKNERRARNGISKDGKEILTWVVAYGPDHHKSA